MNTVQVVVLAVIYDEGKYLVTRRSEPDVEWAHQKWEIPGGGHEFGETTEQTAIREAKEEVGLDVKITKLIPYIFEHQRETWHGVFVSYLCKPLNLDIKLNDEADKYEWLTLPEIKELDEKGEALDGLYAIFFEAEKSLQSGY